MKRIFGVISVIVVVLLLSGVVAGIILYTIPLGPAISIVTQNQDKSTPTVKMKNNNPQLVATQPVDKRYCGNTGVMHLVVIGRASPIDIGMYGADAVRLVIVNFDAPSAAVVALPAELWVNSPILSSQGIEQTKLDLVYQTVWESTPGNQNSVRTQKATQALAQTIYDNFEWIADHYITVEDAAYIKSIDVIGGVNVTLPEKVDGTSEGYGIYPAGLNHLDGLSTLNFTRLLYPSGQPQPDWWGSLSRQDLVLKGMLEAVLRWETIPDLPSLVKTVRKAVTTDLSVNQTLDLTCMLQQVGSTTNLETVGPPPYLVTIDEEGHMIPDVDGIKTLLEQMEGGN
jgi:anionic cell wall polymer biosynthesis LytR-Cps2A-Psr (LCP) family protein